MALGRKQSSGLDISGVGKGHMKLPGGDMKSRTGLQISPSANRGNRGGGRKQRRGSRRKGNYVGESGSGREGRVPRKTLLVLAGVMVGALLLAVAVGYFVYQQTVQNALKPEISQDSLAQVLVEQDSSDDPYWNVLVKTDASSAEAGRGQIQDLALVYADPNNASVSFLWIPADTRVYLDGYGYKTVSDAFSLLGETGLVTSVAKLADVSITHYMEVNEIGLQRFEEDLAPLELQEGDTDKEDLASAVCKRVFGASSEQMSELAGYFTACFATDLDTSEATEVFTSLQGIDTSSDLYQVTAPTTTTQEEGQQYSVIDADSWNSIIARVNTGQSPTASKKELSKYAQLRSTSVIDIWNGVGVSGIANDCSTELKKLGWTIGETGNASQFVYKETLVVYNDSKDKALAELVVSDLGQGRVVAGAARYSFPGDCLVVLGSDYRPY